MTESEYDTLRAETEFKTWWQQVEAPLLQEGNDNVKGFARKVWIAAWTNGYTQGCEDNY